MYKLRRNFTLGVMLLGAVLCLVGNSIFLSLESRADAYNKAFDGTASGDAGMLLNCGNPLTFFHTECGGASWRVFRADSDEIKVPKAASFANEITIKGCKSKKAPYYFRLGLNCVRNGTTVRSGYSYGALPISCLDDSNVGLMDSCKKDGRDALRWKYVVPAA